MVENCLNTKFKPTVLRGHKAEAFTCAWSPVKNLLASAGADNTALLWNFAESTTPKVLHHCIQRGVTDVINAQDVTALAWRKDGSLLATACYDSFIRIWSREGELERTISGYGGPIYTMKWNQTKDLIVAGSGDKTVSVWDPLSGWCILRKKHHSEAVCDVDWQADGCLASCSTDLSIAVFHLYSNKPVQIFLGHVDEINSVKWAPQGVLFATCSDDTTVKVWSAKTQKCVYDLRAHKKEVYAIKWAPVGPGTENPNGNLMLASGGFDSTVCMWNIETGALMKTLKKHTEPVNAIAYSPDGKFLATTGFDKWVHVWTAQTGELVYSYQGSAGMFDVSWNPHSDKIATSAINGSVLVLDLRM